MGRAHPNIEKWFGPLLKRLTALPTSDYIALKWEVDHADEEAQYQRDLGLLDAHLGAAATNCRDFNQLIKERSKPGRDVKGANRMVLDKLAEVRAIAGLLGMGFAHVAYRETPDLLAMQEGTQYAIEVTRLADSPTEHPAVPGETLVAVLGSTDEDARRKLANELVGKIRAKQQQLSSVASSGNHIIWISLGRDYFTAGLYERRLTGLRRQMPLLVGPAVELAAHRVREDLEYAQLRQIIVCPGREKPEIVYCLP